jgi:hypothetical protein
MFASPLAEMCGVSRICGSRVSVVSRDMCDI